MFIIRRITGDSMQPTLPPGELVLAVSWFQTYKLDDVVIINHEGLEKIKRITDIRFNRRGTEIYVRGDNDTASTDSRHFGWLPASSVKGNVLWPISLSRNPPRR